MNNYNEQWRQIAGHANYYISNFGRVKNIQTERILRQRTEPNGYKRIQLQGRNYYVHRLVALNFLENPDEKLLVDHIDNNKINNNVSNLRFATHSQNNMNSVKKEGTSSHYKGVGFHTKSNKWQAQIQINGQKIHIGYYYDEDLAALAYNNKAIELFGPYAKLNDINFQADEIVI